MVESNEQLKTIVDLKSHCKKFMEQLAAQGYSKSTLDFYRLRISCFCEKFESHEFGFKELNGSTIQYLTDVILKETKVDKRKFTQTCIERFVDYLCKVIVISRPVPKRELSALECLKAEYRTYLREQRGLREATIRASIRIFELFITFHFGDTLGDFNTITPRDVTAFLCTRMTKADSCGRKAEPSHLRSTFKFLFWSGKTRMNLMDCIPRVAHPYSGNQPRFLSADKVQRLVDAVKIDNAIGRRNYAMILAAARLGLRGPEVISIQLEDIDWRAGEILIRGKGKYLDRMLLPVDAGEAIVEYIRKGRKGNSRSLFVCNKAPYLPFKDAQIVNSVLRDAFEKTGLKPPRKYVGFHVLRHSLAIEMLRKGAPLGEISDVLRHRSRQTTLIYAKYNIDELRSMAQPWPMQGGNQ